MAKMPKRTLKALKGSIAKWEAIVAGTGTDEGRANCPLCQLFYPMAFWILREEDVCRGCPVKNATGKLRCGDTPYMAWDRHWRGRLDKTARTDKQRALAQAELDFLRSLLPEGE